MRNQSNKTFVLAGDIGGTKTNIGLFQQGVRRPILKVFETYSSREAVDLEEIIQGFIKKHPEPVCGACFGIAGPVADGQCKTTNLRWRVSADRIKRRYRWTHVDLINDLTATAHAIPLLKSHEVFPLNSARIPQRKGIALIAPGTGLGQAFLIFQNGAYVCIPSEGGHADFAPTSEIEVELWRYLHRRFGHVSVERVLSGPGLFNIYSWLRDSGKYKETPWLSQRINNKDPGRGITETALDKQDPLCVETLDIFVAIFGSVAGNLVLTGMTTGGVFLGGGISPRILPFLKKGLFLKSFQDKGRFKAMLQKIPIKVILNRSAALLGAAKYGFDILRK